MFESEKGRHCRDIDLFTCRIDIVAILRVENFLPFTVCAHICTPGSDTEASSSTLRPGDAQDVSLLGTGTELDLALSFIKSDSATLPDHPARVFATPASYCLLGKSSRAVVYGRPGRFDGELHFSAGTEARPLSVTLDGSFSGRNVDAMSRAALDAAVRDAPSQLVAEVLAVLKASHEYAAAREAALARLKDSARTVCAFAPVWVVNRLGLPIEVAQKRALAPVAGSWAATALSSPRELDAVSGLQPSLELYSFSRSEEGHSDEKRHAAVLRVLPSDPHAMTPTLQRYPELRASSWSAPISLTASARIEPILPHLPLAILS